MIINCRLRPGKDDSLRNWYLSLPKGERSRVFRAALKHYAGIELKEVDGIISRSDKAVLKHDTLKEVSGTGEVSISELVKDLFQS